MYEPPQALAQAWIRWVILQLRQLQRLALEGLFSWCEAEIQSGVQDSVDLAKKAEQAVIEALPYGEESIRV